MSADTSPDLELDLRPAPQQVVSDALVFFGATGDLAYKQIFPSLQKMVMRGNLNVPVIGVAKAGWTLDQLRERAKKSVTEHEGLDPAAFEKLLKLLQYIDGDYEDPQTFLQLRKLLGSAQHPTHYLAIPPSLFPVVIEGLNKSGSAKGARVIVEKPFGRDLASARRLNAVLHSAFDESSVFRIDHYLGKEAVENLISFRFANTFLEPIWNSNYVTSIQITMAEAFGVEGRGKFYEETGAIRDVVQNHLLQVLGFLTIDPPTNLYPDALRDEQVKIFRSIPAVKASDLVRGQFVGYRKEPGVAPDSKVETFAALRLEIDSWRWAGVPILIRAGKCLPVTATEVIVKLKDPPLRRFRNTGDYFRFRVGPDLSLALGARVKRPGPGLKTQRTELAAVKMDLSGELDAYERLLTDAMHGDQLLFVRQDAVEAAWAIVDGILGPDTTPVYPYAPGTWGPPESESMAAAIGGWHQPATSATEAATLPE